VPFAICALALATSPKQQRLAANEKLHKQETSIPTRRKKNRRKVVQKVVIREVSTRAGNNNLLLPRSFQSHVTKK
jgi:hypothetical protein